MRKDVKVVVAAACLLLVGLLAYVLFAPGHKTAKVADESSTSSSSSSTDGAGGTATAPPTAVETQPTAEQTPPPAVNVPLNTTPAQPTVSVSVAPATTQPAANTPATVVPSVDSNVAIGATPTASTDWDKTLNSGAVATATGTHASFPGSNNNSALMGTTADTAGSSFSATPTTPTSPSFSAAPSAAQNQSPSASTGSAAKTHKVAYGETLSSIAAEYYGNRASYTKIAAANPGIDPNRLKVGTVLKIPDLKDAARSSSEGSSAAAAAAEKAAPGTTYTVKPGDSLQKISSKLYGSSDKWQKIYELNRSSIGSNPQLLKAGAVLKLPESTASAR